MVIDRKRKLVQLGAESLAEALLELAVRVDVADDLIERIIATPKENIQGFEAKLADLKRRKHFISWKESAAFAYELEMLLENLKSGVEDSRTGVELVAEFYKADRAIFEQCDDSSGNVGDVFRFSAKELFVSYATQCRDKQWVSDLLYELNRNDDYGVRDILVDCATEYLPKLVIRHLIERFQVAASKQSNEYKKQHWLHGVESLARQIKDAPLFEKTRIASWGKLSTVACLDIGRVYLESGDANTALSWLDRISADDTYMAGERDQLLLKIHGRIGNKDKQAAVAWQIFRSYRSSETLADLLSVIGQDQRTAAIESEIAAILKDSKLSLSDAQFLIEMGHINEAETYLLRHTNELNGDFYSGLLPLAEAMMAYGHPLCASVIYRALLDSILRRAQTRTYLHGVRYLKNLDRLATSVSDWRNIAKHTVYMEHLRQKHGRKRTFWSKYEEK